MKQWLLAGLLMVAVLVHAVPVAWLGVKLVDLDHPYLAIGSILVGIWLAVGLLMLEAHFFFGVEI